MGPTSSLAGPPLTASSPQRGRASRKGQEMASAPPADVSPPTTLEQGEAALLQRVAELEVELQGRPRFGLVWEPQEPEHTLLPPGCLVRAGAIVRDRRDLGANQDLVVQSVEGEEVAVCMAGTRRETSLLRRGDLCVVAPLDAPCPLTLTSLGGIHRGGEKAPHLVIAGENHHALQMLARTHAGAVDVIYIDPPYNTGNKDFIYNDHYVNEDDKWRHSKWLQSMDKRLRLAWELLSPTGVIIVSIDDNEMAHLRLLMDQIFYEHNFIGNVVRATNSTKSSSNFLSINFDYTLFYARDKARLELRAKEHGEKWEVLKNNVGEYKRRIVELRKRGLSGEEITAELRELTKYPRFIDFVNYWHVDDRGVYRDGDLGGVTDGNATPLFNPLTERDDPVPPGGYRYDSNKLAGLVADDRIHFRIDGSLPYFKRYLDENTRQRPKGIMSDDQRPDYNLLKAIDVTFDNPKQLSFVRRILSIFGPDALILDFFAGSGTTAQATMELNAEDGGARRCILVTNNEVHPKSRVAQLHREGHFLGDEEYERCGVFEAVTRPRIEAVLTGKRRDGKDVAGKGSNGRPRAEGLDESVEFLRLDCVELEGLDDSLLAEGIDPSALPDAIDFPL